MLLPCRLKIIPSSNLKLIISFLVLPLVLLHSFKLLSFVASMRHAPLTLCVYLRLAIRPSAQFADSPNKNDLQAMGTGTALSASHGGVLVPRVSGVAYLDPKVQLFFPTICSMQEIKKITSNELYTRTNFQQFLNLNEAPQSSLKKLIVSSPLLLQGLHMMSLAKSVPDGLRPRQCK
jgi:hypothetical protein